MAKKLTTHEPIDATVKLPINRDSKALKRVKRYGKSEGIYLSNQQLLRIIEANSGAYGIWFAIGVSENSSKNTVELLPINRTADKIKIAKKGHFKANDNVDYFLNNNTDAQFADSPMPIIEPAAGPTIPSQRTPPPSPE